MKTTHKKIAESLGRHEQDIHEVNLVGAVSEFEGIVSALESSTDGAVTKLGNQLRKWIGTGR